MARSFMYKIKNFLSTGEPKDSFGEIFFKGANRIEIVVPGGKVSGTIELTLEHGNIYVFDKLDNLFAAGKHIAQ